MAWRKTWLGLLLFAVAASSMYPCPAAWAQPLNLLGIEGVSADFEYAAGGYRWSTYRDAASRHEWRISGPRCSVQTGPAKRTSLGDFTGLQLVERGPARLVFETELDKPPLFLRRSYSFCKDGRTLRIETALRAVSEPVFIQRTGLLELKVQGEQFRLVGQQRASSPVFSERLFAGIEHPTAWCQATDSAFFLAQHSHVTVGKHWLPLPPAIFGAASDKDFEAYGKEAPRRAFLRYLNTVRVKPADIHVHYNDWWTAPVPSSEAFVLGNIATLKKSLFDTTGFFFDSYALDAGWSNTHSVWEIDRNHFPEDFGPIRDALAEANARPGLWVSPSSLYPFTLDNQWLKDKGYEVTPNDRLGYNACMVKGGRYQTTFKDAVLRYARDAHLAHMKFDGYIPDCSEEGHEHPPGAESFLSLTNGLVDIFDALRALDPEIALEPTCFGARPSPWWLMHTPFIIGPFGDDSPGGRSPCPEWIESMTTARDIANLNGREYFSMPSSAQQCFDIIVQCPGEFQNHAAMAVGRGRWFYSCYIDPQYMAPEEWQFFADLMRWARHHREFLQEPVPFGRPPEKRMAYGYAFRALERQLFCARNPWIEEAELDLPRKGLGSGPWEARTLYPRRTVLAHLDPGTAETLPVRLGPYETVFVELIPIVDPGRAVPESPPSKRDLGGCSRPQITWTPAHPPLLERLVYNEKPFPYGRSWTCPEGNMQEKFQFQVEGTVEVFGARSAELCLLCDGGRMAYLAHARLKLDGVETELTRSTSEGAFVAAGDPDPEKWTWFLADLPEGKHTVQFQAHAASPRISFALYLRGTAPATESDPPYDDGPAFPLYHPGETHWSETLVPPMNGIDTELPTRNITRTVEHIDGIYLDTLEWKEASAGWGEVRRRISVMEKRMTLGGSHHLRGLGAHATSRIVFDLPEGYATFAATLGKDQEVAQGSVVFIVEDSEHELYRSPVVRHDTPPIELRLPITGAKQLVLRVEDAADGIEADHADWAEARLLH